MPKQQAQAVQVGTAYAFYDPRRAASAVANAFAII